MGEGVFRKNSLVLFFCLERTEYSNKKKKKYTTAAFEKKKSKLVASEKHYTSDADKAYVNKAADVIVRH